jgi:ApbE superfamily uncharacterized protein (UPF0280 family)
MYQPRIYRHWIKVSDLVSFNVVDRETDLQISAQKKLEIEALTAIRNYRAPLEDYIRGHSLFLSSLEPCLVETYAPSIVRDMAEAARLTGVGPMAAVAGAIAQAVGNNLLTYTSEIIIENGGDIFMKVLSTKLIGVYAGDSPLSFKIALEIEPDETPLGICTSSGTVGHSLSFGTADAVVVLSPSAALADAAATAIGNKVKTIDDIASAIEVASHIEGVTGVLVIKDDKMGLWGRLKIAT